MSGSHLQTVLFSLNRPEPVRQASLLMLLASSIGDGESLTEALRTHAGDCGSPWADRVQALRLLLEQGQTLSSALSSSAGLLPDSTLIAIRVAEQNGTLRNVLVDEAERLVNASARGGATGQNPLGLLIWMAAVVSVAACILMFMMVFIIPKFKHLFESFDLEIPGPTRQLIAFADQAAWSWPLLVLPAVTCCLLVIGVAVWAGLLKLTRGLLPFCQHWPRYWMPDVLRMLSFTVASGAPLSGTLHCLSREMHPGRAAESFSRLRTLVDEGTDCVTAMRDLRLLSRKEAAFLQSAERTHHLDWAFQHLSRAIGRTRTRYLDRMVALSQPLFIAVIGVVIGMVVISLFYPLIALLTSLD